ncbi:Transcriptional regulator TetR family [Paramagnetospirillum magnetotacticum MS-1]|uniref:Transcriptional regulator TetR family n=1 Tax=Paramagnetospirillum magnetotacticum MS-1 TaxID=272627 RepID=A0A0C2U816_PARME|nr:TetR/AcrR family transcriptional regulator [Paramagnetospirillum magnetotacticum]KIL97592.1 Transcriptional regulator TetR family [Paramagnetospirillum magnetotacticum MS-1]
MTMTRTRSKPSAKREAILDAAQRLFLVEGYAATSMDAVAAGAEVSKATIYAHFEGKDQLFAAIMHRRCEASFAFASPDESFDAERTFTTYAERLLGLLMTPDAMALYRVVVAESARTPELAQAFYETGPIRGKAAIAASVACLQARGELATDIDPLVIADQFIGMLRAETYHRALLGLPEGRSVAKTIAAAVQTLMRAYGKR